MGRRLAILVLLSIATLVPHGPICANVAPLSTLLGLGPVREVAHVVVHALLFGLLAAALSAWIVRTDRAPERVVRVRAALSLAWFVFVVLARQAVQLVVLRATPGAEQAFELSLDAVAGAIGAIGWALVDPVASRRVARALGWLFHPAVIAPLGFFAVCWSRTESAQVAARWTALLAIFELPAIAAWLHGVRRARFSDADVSLRHERLPLLAFGVVCALGLLGGTLVLGAPPVVVRSALGAILGAALAAVITRGGLKLSGHVAVAAGPAFALFPEAPRGALVFAMMAAVLVWARVKGERHTPYEAAAGFVLAAVVAVVSMRASG